MIQCSGSCLGTWTLNHLYKYVCVCSLNFKIILKVTSKESNGSIKMIFTLAISPHRTKLVQRELWNYLVIFFGCFVHWWAYRLKWLQQFVFSNLAITRCTILSNKRLTSTSECSVNYKWYIYHCHHIVKTTKKGSTFELP